ncbi:MAG: Rpn family recombination-promoting nuclease/putative transposase, partial [Planctomycetaceae bacterium]|jgi:predicted transposase/invertase (TIGR01784 family)|nr:Rpn family recombination-promoting nuclease/putative transposase [Planctomycetaceae bacterium]
MIFLQMPLFRLTESELVTRQDKWLFFLKNLESFDDIPSIFHEPVFEKAFDAAEYYKYSPKLQEAYQNDLKVYRDNRNVVETARIEGEKKGKAEGLAEAARNLKIMGFSLPDIAKATGLSIDEIKQLSER